VRQVVCLNLRFIGLIRWAAVFRQKPAWILDLERIAGSATLAHQVLLAHPLTTIAHMSKVTGLVPNTVRKVFFAACQRPLYLVGIRFMLRLPDNGPSKCKSMVRLIETLAPKARRRTRSATWLPVGVQTILLRPPQLERASF
jgi:hypothetical protein